MMLQRLHMLSALGGLKNQGVFKENQSKSAHKTVKKKELPKDKS